MKGGGGFYLSSSSGPRSALSNVFLCLYKICKKRDSFFFTRALQLHKLRVPPDLDASLSFSFPVHYRIRTSSQNLLGRRKVHAVLIHRQQGMKESNVVQKKTK